MSAGLQFIACYNLFYPGHPLFQGASHVLLTCPIVLHPALRAFHRLGLIQLTPRDPP